MFPQKIKQNQKKKKINKFFFLCYSFKIASIDDSQFLLLLIINFIAYRSFPDDDDDDDEVNHSLLFIFKYL